jgi:hypothetical protein
MTKTVFGTVRGNTIELNDNLGLPDGQQVEITIRPTQTQKPGPWGEGLRRCAGALAGIPGLDEDMDEILRGRNTAKFRDVLE